MDQNYTQYGGIYDNGTNLWIGSIGGTGPHHCGRTYISAGYDIDNAAGFGTAYISVPNSVNTNCTSYEILHAGNYTSYCAKASHTHSYLPLSGGALTGDVTLTKSSGATFYRATSASNSASLYSATNAGVYHETAAGYGTGKWLINISTAGTVTANTSDLRWKNVKGNLAEDEAVTILREVPIINFVYKEDVGHFDLEQSGIGAQNLRDTLLEHNYLNRGYIVLSNNVNPDDTDSYYDITLPEKSFRYEVNYEKFIPLLWKGWQSHDNHIASINSTLTEHTARIESHDYQLTQVFDRIAKLEKENETLKQQLQALVA